MSTLVGSVVASVRDDYPQYPAPVVASALALACGFIVTSIGLIRCGWIVELISLTSLSAFMTGSSITICVGQVPALLGIRGINNRESPYLVLVNTLRNLPKAQLDSAVGMSALFLLYLIRYSLAFAAGRRPRTQRLFYFISTLRTVFVILLYTMISWLVNRHHREEPLFKILGDIPTGEVRPVLFTTPI
jgi:solute carrier family 26 (sodium-independent sulfate anion transporter), member 11